MFAQHCQLLLLRHVPTVLLYFEKDYFIIFLLYN